MNLKRPRRVDDYGIEFNFCPGKATWYPEIGELFHNLRVAMETGILPFPGGLQDQPAEFVECLPIFVDRWKERNYQRIWRDVSGYVKLVLESIFGKK